MSASPHVPAQNASPQNPHSMDPTQGIQAASDDAPPQAMRAADEAGQSERAAAALATADAASDAPARADVAAAEATTVEADAAADTDTDAEDSEALAAQRDSDTGQSDDEDDVEIEERESVYSIYADDDAAEDEAAAAASAAASGSSGSTSGGSAIGIDELAIEKWSEEQKKVYESVKQKTQELGVAKDDVERIAAYSVLQFMNEKDRKPDTRVDRVQAVNANGDVLVRMEHMKYGDREPIFNNDVRLKDAPAFEQTAAQIQQANERVHGKSKTEQEIAQYHQNQDTNQQERPNTLQLIDDQISARVQSSMPALSRGGR